MEAKCSSQSCDGELGLSRVFSLQPTKLFNELEMGEGQKKIQFLSVSELRLKGDYSQHECRSHQRTSARVLT